MVMQGEKEISTDQLLSAVRLIVTHLKQKGDITDKEIQDLLSPKDELSIPLSLFKNEKLSSLEIITKYLKESKNFNFRQIGNLLNRNERTIWTTYQNALKKEPGLFKIESHPPSFPASILTTRKLSVLEAICIHLKTQYSTAQIAQILRKPYTTIWATLKSAVNKNE